MYLVDGYIAVFALLALTVWLAFGVAGKNAVERLIGYGVWFIFCGALVLGAYLGKL